MKKGLKVLCAVLVASVGLFIHGVVASALTEEEIVNNFIEQVESKDFYVIDDLNLIDYYLHKDVDYNGFPDYVKELKNLMEEQNIRIELDPSGQMGDYSLIRYEGRNSGDVYYNDIVYGQVGVMEFHLIHRLYIPADTEETQEAYIEAATEKLTSAFPDAVVKVTYGGTVEALEDMTTEKLEDVGNPTEYYMISINGEIYNFILEKSTEETGFSKTDEVAGVTVETDADISSDAELVVEKITEDKEEYDLLNGLFSNSDFIAFNFL